MGDEIVSEAPPTRLRRTRMLVWLVLLGPFGILAYRYRWARLAILLVLSAICFAAGGTVGIGIGIVLLLLVPVSFLARVMRHS